MTDNRGGTATLTFGGSIAGPSSVTFNGLHGADGKIFTGSLSITGTAGVTTQTVAGDQAITGRRLPERRRPRCHPDRRLHPRPVATVVRTARLQGPAVTWFVLNNAVCAVRGRRRR